MRSSLLLLAAVAPIALIAWGCETLQCSDTNTCAGDVPLDGASGADSATDGTVATGDGAVEGGELGDATVDGGTQPEGSAGEAGGDATEPDGALNCGPDAST